MTKKIKNKSNIKPNNTCVLQLLLVVADADFCPVNVTYICNYNKKTIYWDIFGGNKSDKTDVINEVNQCHFV